VRTRYPLSADQLLSLGQLAMTEDTRPIFVRRKGESLKTKPQRSAPLIASTKVACRQDRHANPFRKVMFIY